MKKVSAFTVVFLFALFVFLFFSRPDQSAAQGANFYRIYPFSTAGGQVGFFDQGTGKIYIYDAKLENCISIVQLEELGGPLKSVKAGAK